MFSSAQGVASQLLGHSHSGSDETLKGVGGKGEGATVDGVFIFTEIPFVLSFDTCGMASTYGGAYFFEDSNCIVRILFGDHGAALSKHLWVRPFDGLQKTLTRSRGDVLLTRDGFDNSALCL